jgi:hypothetical protein
MEEGRKERGEKGESVDEGKAYLSKSLYPNAVS